MMFLNTKPIATDDPTRVRVAWAVGSNRNGFLEVVLPKAYAEPELIAELVAIRYLVCKNQVFGTTTLDGKGIQLNISCGAIKKLALDKSTKEEAKPYAKFLNQRYTKVVFCVKKNNPLIPTVKEGAECVIVEADDEYKTPYEALSTPALGEIFVTDHAVQRYMERVESGTPNDAYRSLANRLMHPKLTQMMIPKNHLAHKARKYGSDNNIELWAHNCVSLSFLVLNTANKKRILLTVFVPQVQ